MTETVGTENDLPMSEVHAPSAAPKSLGPLNDAELASMFATLDSDAPGASTWSTSYDGARRILATIAHLQSLVYVPGQWRCAKCRFVLQRMTINPVCDRIGVSERDRNEPERCPNGCGPLWRVSEREAGNEVCDRLALTERQQAEIMTADSWLKAPPGNPFNDLAVAVVHLRRMIEVARR